VRDLRLVIFDCDGVLVDSERISNGVLARLLSAEGLSTTLAQARRDYQGLLLGEVFERAEQKLGRALPEDLPSRFESERAEVFRRELEPVPGAAGAVEWVAAAGVAACVASQGKLEKTRLNHTTSGFNLFIALINRVGVARLLNFQQRTTSKPGSSGCSWALSEFPFWSVANSYSVSSSARMVRLMRGLRCSSRAM